MYDINHKEFLMAKNNDFDNDNFEEELSELDEKYGVGFSNVVNKAMKRKSKKKSAKFHKDGFYDKNKK